MKKIFFVLTGFAALITSYISGAQETNPIKDKSLLWRISGNQLAKPSYLFGTIHMICRDDFIWTEKMREGLNKSEKVCFEMNLNDPNVISEATTALIETLGKKLMGDASGDMLKMMESLMNDSTAKDKALTGPTDPMALQSMMGAAGLNCDNPVSYEDSIMKMALVDKKEIMGLEKPAEQVAVLETIPLDSLVAMLMDNGKGQDSSDHENEEMTKAYKTQDLPGLYDLIASAKGPGVDMGALLDDRNKKWIPRMTEKMNVSSVFFAVGAGHLAGQNGVINLLRKAGYKVEPVK